MAAISTRMPAIAVEYDGPKGRRRKEFKSTELGAARRLYAKKLAEGKNPELKKTVEMTPEQIAARVDAVAYRLGIPAAATRKHPDALKTEGLRRSDVTFQVIEIADRIAAEKTEHVRANVERIAESWDEWKETFGATPLEIIRWMARDAWTPDEVLIAVRAFGLPLSAAEVRAAWLSGRRKLGVAATPTPEQIEKLYELLATPAGNNE